MNFWTCVLVWVYFLVNNNGCSHTKEYQCPGHQLRLEISRKVIRCETTNYCPKPYRCQQVQEGRPQKLCCTEDLSRDASSEEELDASQSHLFDLFDSDANVSPKSLNEPSNSVNRKTANEPISRQFQQQKPSGNRQAIQPLPNSQTGTQHLISVKPPGQPVQYHLINVPFFDSGVPANARAEAQATASAGQQRPTGNQAAQQAPQPIVRPPLNNPSSRQSTGIVQQIPGPVLTVPVPGPNIITPVPGPIEFVNVPVEAPMPIPIDVPIPVPVQVPVFVPQPATTPPPVVIPQLIPAPIVLQPQPQTVITEVPRPISINIYSSNPQQPQTIRVPVPVPVPVPMPPERIPVPVPVPVPVPRPVQQFQQLQPPNMFVAGDGCPPGYSAVLTQGFGLPQSCCLNAGAYYHCPMGAICVPLPGSTLNNQGICCSTDLSMLLPGSNSNPNFGNFPGSNIIDFAPNMNLPSINGPPLGFGRFSAGGPNAPFGAAGTPSMGANLGSASAIASPILNGPAPGMRGPPNPNQPVQPGRPSVAVAPNRYRGVGSGIARLRVPPGVACPPPTYACRRAQTGHTICCYFERTAAAADANPEWMFYQTGRGQS